MESQVPTLIAQLRGIIDGLPLDSGSRTAWDAVVKGMEGLAGSNLIDADEVQSVIDELMEGGPEAVASQAANLILEFTQHSS